jgi:hypothetical protein
VRTLVGGTDQIIKRALASSNLLPKIKKAWRARVTPKEDPDLWNPNISAAGFAFTEWRAVAVEE